MTKYIIMQIPQDDIPDAYEMGKLWIIKNKPFYWGNI